MLISLYAIWYEINIIYKKMMRNIINELFLSNYYEVCAAKLLI